MGDTAKTLNVLRNAMELSGFLAEQRESRPQVSVDEGLAAISFICQVEVQGDAWRAGELLGRQFPKADLQITSEPNGTFVVTVPLKSLMKDWGPPALPAGPRTL